MVVGAGPAICRRAAAGVVGGDRYLLVGKTESGSRAGTAGRDVAGFDSTTLFGL
jgi:hypothetical protein